MKKTVGILGGTFNPIHLGHVMIAKAAYDQFAMDKIIIMPSGDPSSYKDTSQIVSSSDRCNMINLAISDYPFMELSTLELERQGKTYTADTLLSLKEEYNYIYFIIGADSLLQINKWHKPEVVCSNCHLLCANRDEHPGVDLLSQKKYLESKYNAVIDFISCENLPYSSTNIRNSLANNLIVHGLDKKVYSYIKNNKLYT